MQGHPVAVLLLLLALGLAREDSDGGEEDYEFAPPLQLNRPTLLHGLVSSKLQCRGIQLPAYHHAWVSLVGIVGFPQVFAAATPEEAVKALKRAQLLGLKNLAGWQVLGIPGGRDANFTFLCFNTASRQAGEASLTVAIQNQTPGGNETAERAPAIELAPGYTSMWLLEPKDDGDSAATPSLCFFLPVDPMGDILVSVGPMDGEADLEVFDGGVEGCGAGEPLISSRLPGPDVLEFAPLAHGFGPLLHIRVTGSGHTALTAGPREPGPLLAAGVPVAGRLTPRWDGSPACNKARLVVEEGANFTVVATSEGGAKLQLDAAFLNEPPDRGAWKVQRLPGIGHDVALLIQAPGKPSEEAVVVSLTICLDPGAREGPQQPALYWLTATPDAAETTLLDGEPLSVPSPQDLNWHLFRFRVNCGGHMLVTLSVDSPEPVELMADVGTAAVHEQNRSSFRWEAEGQRSQHPVMQFTSDPQLETSQVHLIRSRCPSYVYAAVRNVESSVEEGRELWWKILATSSQGEKVLLEAKDVEESLDEGRAQIFRYNVEEPDSAVMFSITVLTGEVVFDVSASIAFPDKENWTIKDAHLVVLLPPMVGPFKVARELAQDAGRSPVLYMRVRSTSRGASSFTAAARKHNDLREIRVGERVSGAVQLFGYDRYYFRISSESLQDRLIVDVTRGFLDPPTLFVGCDGNRYPQRGYADWFLHVNDSAGASIVLDPASHQCREGIFYVAFTSTNRSAYTMQVDLMIPLQDGVEQFGQVARDHRSIYTLLPQGGQPRYSPLAIRAQAVSGSFSFCVLEPQAILQRLPSTAEDCSRLGIFAANLSSADGGEEVLAAVDLPARLPQIALLVFGSAAESSFYVSVLVDSPEASTTLAKGHAVVADAAVAPCCRGNATLPEYTIKRYRYSAPAAESASSVLLLELNALRRGEHLEDVLLQAGVAPGRTSAGPYSSHRGGTVGPVRLMVDAARLLSFKILVNATGRANFSLNITQFEQERRQQLLPNATLRSELRSALSVDELRLPSSSSASSAPPPEALRLRLEQCSGRVRAALWGPGVEEGLEEGVNLDMTLPPSARSLLVAPASANASYEVQLRPREEAGPREEAILLPDPPILIPRWYRGSISFVFGAAAAAAAAGGTEPASSLRYTLVAARKNDSANFHLNASCGIREALQAGSLFAAEQLGKPGLQRGEQLEVPLPVRAVELFRQEQSLWVNVLVTLQRGTDAADAPAAKRSYALFDLDPTRKDLQLDARHPDASGFFGAIAIFIAFCACWSTVSRCNWCNRSAAPDQIAKDDDVELEVQYDLHHEAAMDLLPATRSTYVPPTM